MITIKCINYTDCISSIVTYIIYTSTESETVATTEENTDDNETARR